MKVTQNDLLDALRDALAQPSAAGGATVGELAVSMGCGDEKVRKVLKVLAGQGRLEVSRAQRPALDGRLMPVPTYRIKAR